MIQINANKIPRYFLAEMKAKRKASPQLTFPDIPMNIARGTQSNDPNMASKKKATDGGSS